MATTTVALRVTVYILTLFSLITASRSEILELKLGKIRGERKTVNEKQIDVYLGVPYAEPPVGSLRFRKPAPKKPWTRIIDATEYGPSCIQMFFPGMSDTLQHIDISEDCLSLNVYVPVSENKEPRAVMVWIHGGGYGLGQGMATPGEELALHGDIVCVTINYRLGFFGFLSTQDENAPGNFGLWDQHEALKWVKEHISSFGGDSESITIFGESAGGSSVQHQAVSKYNFGIVKRAISQSPPTFSSGFAFSMNAPLDTAKHLGRQLNCNTTDNKDLDDTLKLVNCLRLASVDDILNKTDEITQANMNEEDPSYGMIAAPVEDGDFVPYGLREYFSASKGKNNPEIDDTFGKVDWMIGSLVDEGHILLYIASMAQDIFGFNLTHGIPEAIMGDKFIAPLVKSWYPDFLETVKKRTQDFYTHKADPIENTLALRDFFSDVLFHLHVVESCLAHVRAKRVSGEAEKGATYAYLVSHVLSGKNVIDYLIGFGLPSWTKCASHGDDIPLIFGTHFLKEVEFEWSEEDAKTAKAVRTYWTNFAKTGNPNSGLPLEGVAPWEEYTKEKKGFINIGKEIKMDHDLLPDRMKLWMHTIPEEIEKQRAMKQKSEL